MKLTQEQMTYLSRFEGNMLTAVRSNWTSPLSASDLQMVADIYNKVTGQSRRANANCASCILELLTDMGRIYFAQKEASQAETKPKVRKSSTKVAKVAGVAVKTKKTAKQICSTIFHPNLMLPAYRRDSTPSLKRVRWLNSPKRRSRHPIKTDMPTC